MEGGAGAPHTRSCATANRFPINLNSRSQHKGTLAVGELSGVVLVLDLLQRRFARFVQDSQNGVQSAKHTLTACSLVAAHGDGSCFSMNASNPSPDWRLLFDSVRCTAGWIT